MKHLGTIGLGSTRTEVDDVGPRWTYTTGTLANDASVTLTHAADANGLRTPRFDVWVPTDGTQFLLNANGTDGATSVEDQSAYCNDPTFAGSAQLDTAQKKYGSASLYLPGASGDYVSLAGLALGSADFTIETWFRTASLSENMAIFENRTGGDGTGQVLVYTDSTASNVLKFYTSSADRCVGATSLSTNTWYHIALERVGTSIKLWLDGVQQGSTYTASTNFATTSWLLGTDFTGTLSNESWYDDLRFTVGANRYGGATFTPPASELSIPTAYAPAILSNSFIANSTCVWVAPGNGSGADITTKTTFTNQTGRKVRYRAAVLIDKNTAY